MPERLASVARKPRGAEHRDDTDAAPSAFSWRYPHTPATIRRHWHAGVLKAVTAAALVQFERVHWLESGTWPIYGTKLTPMVWSALLRAAALHEADPDDYRVALANESEPEQLRVWRDGRIVLRTLVNTGVPGGATPHGLFYVYPRYQSQTMHGVITAGVPYVYRNVPDVDYFSGNDAIEEALRLPSGPGLRRSPARDRASDLPGAALRLFGRHLLR